MLQVANTDKFNKMHPYVLDDILEKGAKSQFVKRHQDSLSFGIHAHIPSI